MLQLVLPRQQIPLDLGRVLGEIRQMPPFAIATCRTVRCPAEGLLMPSNLITTPGQLLLVHVVRNGGIATGLQGKVLTPLQQPPANHMEWPGLRPVVVLAHRAPAPTVVGGHWVAFIEVAGIWWKVDSATQRPPYIVQEDPWVVQLDPTLSNDGFTIDVVMFTP